jgi:hypothetical protein
MEIIPEHKGMTIDKTVSPGASSSGANFELGMTVTCGIVSQICRHVIGAMWETMSM